MAFNYYLWICIVCKCFGKGGSWGKRKKMRTWKNSDRVNHLILQWHDCFNRNWSLTLHIANNFLQIFYGKAQTLCIWLCGKSFLLRSCYQDDWSVGNNESSILANTVALFLKPDECSFTIWRPSLMDVNIWIVVLLAQCFNLWAPKFNRSWISKRICDKVRVDRLQRCVCSLDAVLLQFYEYLSAL